MFRLDKISFVQVFVFLFILATICYGTLVILLFNKELITSLSLGKIILLSAAFVAPFLIINIALMPLVHIKGILELEEKSVSEIMYVGAFLTTSVLYVALAKAYFESTDLKSFISQLLVGEFILIISLIVLRIFKIHLIK